MHDTLTHAYSHAAGALGYYAPGTRQGSGPCAQPLSLSVMAASSHRLTGRVMIGLPGQSCRGQIQLDKHLHPAVNHPWPTPQSGLDKKT